MLATAEAVLATTLTGAVEPQLVAPPMFLGGHGRDRRDDARVPVIAAALAGAMLAAVPAAAGSRAAGPTRDEGPGGQAGGDG